MCLEEEEIGGEKGFWEDDNGVTIAFESLQIPL